MLLLAGCRSDEILESPDAPAVYYDLLDAMTAGKRLDGVERAGESTLISFSDGSRLEIPLKELFIYDCTESDPVAVTVNNATGTWMIGQKDTGISESASASVWDCKPVYALDDRQHDHQQWRDADNPWSFRIREAPSSCHPNYNGWKQKHLRQRDLCSGKHCLRRPGLLVF